MTDSARQVTAPSAPLADAVPAQQDALVHGVNLDAVARAVRACAGVRAGWRSIRTRSRPPAAQATAPPPHTPHLGRRDRRHANPNLPPYTPPNYAPQPGYPIRGGYPPQPGVAPQPGYPPTDPYSGPRC
jgi:hypothetical protein